MRRSSWSGVATPGQPLDLTQSFSVLRSELLSSGGVRVAPCLGSHLPGCQFAWENLLTSMCEEHEIGEETLSRMLEFMREVYKEIKIQPEGLPYSLIRPEVLVVMLVTLLKISSKAVSLFSSSPAQSLAPCLLSLVPQVPLLRELLYLFEFMLKKHPSELQLSPQVTALCSNALTALQATLPVMTFLSESQDLKAIVEAGMRILMSVGAYVTAIASVGAGSEALSGLLEQIKSISAAGLTNEAFDFSAGTMEHNYAKCTKGCGLCTGQQATLRYAMISSLIPLNDFFLNVQIENVVLELLQEALRSETMPRSSVLTYAFLYLNLCHDAELPPDPLLCSLGKLFKALRDIKKLDSDSDRTLPRWASPVDLSRCFSWLLGQLSGKLDRNGVLISFVEFSMEIEAVLQIDNFEEITRVLELSFENRFMAAKLQVVGKLLERFPLSPCICRTLSRMCEQALYPAELAAIIHRIHLSLCSPVNLTETQFFLSVLIAALARPINSGEKYRNSKEATWRTDSDVYYSSAADAIRSLGGLSVFLMILDYVEFIGSDFETIRVMLLRLIIQAKSLIDQEFIEYLSVKLEDKSDIPFSEDSVLLILQIFYEFNKPNEGFSIVAADSLILVPKLWENLPDSLYHCHIASATLNCLSHYQSEGQTAEAMNAGKQLLDEIYRRKNYAPLFKMKVEVNNMIQSTLMQSMSELEIRNWLSYALRSLSEDVEKSCEICSHVLHVVSCDREYLQFTYEQTFHVLNEFAKSVTHNSSKLTPFLVQILYYIGKPRRVKYNPNSGRWSMRKGMDESSMPLMKKIVKELDIGTFDLLVRLLRDDWGVTRRKIEEIEDKRLVTITSLIPRSTADSFEANWDCFCSLLDTETLRFLCQPNFPLWLVGVYDRAIAIDPNFDFNRKFWPKAVKLFLAKTPISMSAIRVFVYRLWHLKPKQDRSHFMDFIRLLLSSAPTEGPAWPVFVRDLLLVLEEMVLAEPLLASDLDSIIREPKVASALLTPASDEILSHSPYEKVFNQSEDSLPRETRSTAGGLRRVLVSLTIACMRVVEDVECLLDVLKTIVKNSYSRGKTAEDVFQSDGFIDCWILAELTVLTLDSQEPKRRRLLQAILNLTPSLGFLKMQSMFRENDASLFQYRELLRQKHASDLLHKHATFRPLDSMDLRRGLRISPDGRFDESDETNHADSSLAARIFRENLLEVQKASDVQTLWTRITGIEWQESVLLYLLINTRLRMEGIYIQAKCYKAVFESTFVVGDKTNPSTLDTESSEITKGQMKLPGQDKQIHRIYIHYRWKAKAKTLTGIYGLWKSDEESKYWKIANFTDCEGRRTRIKLKKNAQTHQDAVTRRQPYDIKRRSNSSVIEAINVPSLHIDCGSSASECVTPRPNGELTPSEMSLCDSSSLFTSALEEERRPSIDLSMLETGLELPCERIMCKGTFYGQLSLNKNFILFKSTELPEDFNELDNAALERMQELLKKAATFTKQIHRVLNPKRRRYEAKRCRNAWLKGEMTNCEYLSALNKLSSRSFNETSQYPVFPWVLRDYENSTIDLSSTSAYRDFEQNVGAQLKESRLEARKRYELMEEADMEPCHFGSHFSTSGIVSYYLIRLEPYVSAAIDIQDKSFDVADRIFASLETAWKGCLSNSGDFKELIPEFFCLPEALLNLNQYDFGLTQGGVNVNDVILPSWVGQAGSSLGQKMLAAYNFVRMHERALESPIAKRGLPAWIDLVFGFKQKSKRAVDALNVFFPYTYQEKFERAYELAPEIDREGIRQQVIYYGQTPLLLFNKTVPHPQTILPDVPQFDAQRENAYSAPWELIIKRLDMSKVVKIIYSDGRIALITVKRSAILIGKKINNGAFKRGAKEPVEEMVLKPAPKQPESVFEGRQLLAAGCFLLTCRLSQCSFQVHSLETGELLASVQFHSLPVNALAFDNGLLVAGSEDCTISMWTVTRIIARNQIAATVTRTGMLYGHRRPVTAVALSVKTDIVVSSDQGGVVLLHSCAQSVILAVISVPEQPHVLLSISRLRLVAVYTTGSQEVHLFTFTGMRLPSIPLHLNRDTLTEMQFTAAGDRMVACSSNVAVYSVFPNYNPQQENPVFYREVQRGCISPDSENLFIQTLKGVWVSQMKTSEGWGVVPPSLEVSVN